MLTMTDIIKTAEYEELSCNLNNAEMLTLNYELSLMQDDTHIMHYLKLRCGLLIDSFT